MILLVPTMFRVHNTNNELVERTSQTFRILRLGPYQYLVPCHQICLPYMSISLSKVIPATTFVLITLKKNVSVKLYVNNSCVKLMINIIDRDLRADELTKMWELF